MHLMEATFLSDDWHQSTRNVGGVLAAFVRAKFPRDTIKRTAAALGCTLPAAANVTKGHASERIITKAHQTWPFEFSEAIDRAFTGMTRAEYLKRIIDEEAREHERRQAERLEHQRMEERALDVLRLSDRQVA